MSLSMYVTVYVCHCLCMYVVELSGVSMSLSMYVTVYVCMW